MMNKNEQLAHKYFTDGYNCAQSVFAAFHEEMGMDEKTALKISSAFGGGLGRLREVCGAVSGMFMVLSCLYGYDDPNAGAEKKQLYARVQELAGKFRDINGSIICRELLDNPPSDPNPSPRTAQYYAQRPCVRMVMTAADLLDEFIENNPI